MLHFHGYLTLHGYKTSTLTAWKISIPIPVKNLEGQSIHGIRQAKKGLKGLKLCKGNLSEKKIQKKMLAVSQSIYIMCVYSLSLSLSRHNNINNKMVNSSYPSLEVSTLEANSFNVYSSQFSPRKPRYLCMRSP